MIKFIAADLDGTLLDSKKRLPADFKEVIEKLDERGIIFAPASGRQYYNLLKRFEPFGRNFMYIAENGSMVVKNGKSVIFDGLDRDDAVEAIELARHMPTASAILCGEDCAFGENGDNEEFLRNAHMYYENFRIVDNIMEYCDHRNICKVAVFDSEDAEKNIYGRFIEVSKGQVILSGDKWVDIMKPGVSKGSAVRRIREKYGFEKDECMAFGDYLNDCEMLDECGYGYAMENAHEELFSHARYKAPSNDENGVMRTIREVLKI